MAQQTALPTAAARAAIALTVDGGIATAGAAEADFTYPAALDPSTLTIKTDTGHSTDKRKKKDRLHVDAEWSVPSGASSSKTSGIALLIEFGIADAGHLCCGPRRSY